MSRVGLYRVIKTGIMILRSIIFNSRFGIVIPRRFFFVLILIFLAQFMQQRIKFLPVDFLIKLLSVDFHIKYGINGKFHAFLCENKHKTKKSESNYLCF